MLSVWLFVQNVMANVHFWCGNGREKSTSSHTIHIPSQMWESMLTPSHRARIYRIYMKRYDTIEYKHKTTNYKQWIHIHTQSTAINKVINNNQMLRLSLFDYISGVFLPSFDIINSICYYYLVFLVNEHFSLSLITCNVKFVHRFETKSHRKVFDLLVWWLSMIQMVLLDYISIYILSLLFFIAAIRSNRINKSKLIFCFMFAAVFCSYEFSTTHFHSICLASLNCPFRLSKIVIHFEWVCCAFFSIESKSKRMAIENGRCNEIKRPKCDWMRRQCEIVADVSVAITFFIWSCQVDCDFPRYESFNFPSDNHIYWPKHIQLHLPFKLLVNYFYWANLSHMIDFDCMFESPISNPNSNTSAHTNSNQIQCTYTECCKNTVFNHFAQTNKQTRREWAEISKKASNHSLSAFY